MNATTSFKQQGAVLAFTLFMLVLLTMAGVTMVQQNKLDFLMVKNTRDQTNAFTSIEQELSLIELGITSAILNGTAVHSSCTIDVNCGSPQPTAGALNTKVALNCTPTDNGTGRLVQTPLYAGQILTGATTTGTVTAVSCLKDVVEYSGQAALQENFCTTYDTKGNDGIAGTGDTNEGTIKTYCYPDNSLASRVACTPTTTSPVPNLGTTVVVSNWECYRSLEGDAKNAHCPTEIYTIRLSSPANTSGASRTIESKYGVDCGVL